MVETFEKLMVALINDHSNLMIIKTLPSKSVVRRIYFINLSKSYIKLHVVYVTHFTFMKSKTFKREL